MVRNQLTISQKMKAYIIAMLIKFTFGFVLLKFCSPKFL